MEPIYPLNEETISRYCGQLVCVVMQDGTQHIGRLSSCRSGKILLNEEAEAEAEAETEAVIKGKAGARRTGRQARGRRLKHGRVPVKGLLPGGIEGAGLGPYPYAPFRPVPFGPRIALDLALVAFLFRLLI